MTELNLRPPPTLDAVARRTLQLDLAYSFLFACTQAVLEMGGALAKKAFQATDTEVALLTSGQSAGLILSFFVAHLAASRRKMPLVFWPEAARSAALCAVYFVKPAFAMGFVICHALASMFHSMTIPARVAIYDQNYPMSVRGRIVGRNRQVQFLVAAIASLLVSSFLDGVNYLHLPGIDSLLARWAPHRSELVVYLVPAIGIVGFLGTVTFACAPVRDAGVDGEGVPGSIGDTLRKFLRVWREDRDFRRYQNFFFVFGFANIMTISLTQIHAVDRLHASYFDLAMINVAIIQGLMAITMPSWGKLVDRHPPARLRGYINLIFSIDFLVLAFAPSIGWVYVGRVCRGIALGGGTLIWMLGSLYYARTPENVPVYLGIHTVLTGFRWALAPFAGVWLKKAFANDARPVFFIVFLIVAGSALMLIRESKREAPRGPVEGPAMPAPRMTGA